MRRYTKKPKPLSRKALERNLRKAEALLKEQFVTIEGKSETIQRLRGGLQSTQSRVRELEERLDGIFLPVKYCFHAEAKLDRSSVSTHRVGMPTLCLYMRIDDFHTPKAYNPDHMKAHIVDMMVRDLREKALKAISVL